MGGLIGGWKWMDGWMDGWMGGVRSKGVWKGGCPCLGL